MVSSPDQLYLHKASLMGYKALFDYTTLNKTKLEVPDKAILLVPVFWQDHQFVKEYIENNHPVIFKNIGGTSFYIEEINPR